MLLASDGYLYGTTEGGGAGGYGTVFKLATTGTFTTIGAFNYWNGAYPTSTLVADDDGGLYGVTEQGGLFGDGPAFRVRIGAPSTTTAPTAPANLSTRAQIGTGDKILIGGFINDGSVAKKVIVRALGPSLLQSGITNPLADPTLTIYDANGSIIGANDNWRDGSDAAFVASTLPPKNDLEAVVSATFSPGAYTTLAQGKNGATGIGLVELYDMETSSASKLLNLSTRATVGTGDGVVIGGFIISGQDPAKVLLRGLGSSLIGDHFTWQDVNDSPKLELHDASGKILSANIQWVQSSQKKEIADTGIPPTADNDSAIIATLSPGSYTVVLSPYTGAHTGIGLIEIYSLPQ